MAYQFQMQINCLFAFLSPQLSLMALSNFIKKDSMSQFRFNSPILSYNAGGPIEHILCKSTTCLTLILRNNSFLRRPRLKCEVCCVLSIFRIPNFMLQMSRISWLYSEGHLIWRKKTTSVPWKTWKTEQ